MPFMSYQVNIEEAVRNAGRFIKEANVDAVKLEGRYFETIRRLTEAGIPVVGHLGLTPQSASLLGGYVVQGKTFDKAKRLIQDAESIEESGAIMLVLEMVPEEVGSIISRRLRIPVIGIGAGAGCDGQVLVLHDMLGLGGSFKFLKKYANLKGVISDAIKNYISDVKGKRFPSKDNSFQMPPSELKRLRRYFK
jgi:3-methyl-2-oxobutanoate hydroxymethyltransferase